MSIREEASVEKEEESYRRPENADVGAVARVVVVGPPGSGKTTMIDALLGARAVASLCGCAFDAFLPVCYSKSATSAYVVELCGRSLPRIAAREAIEIFHDCGDAFALVTHANRRAIELFDRVRGMEDLELSGVSPTDVQFWSVRVGTPRAKEAREASLFELIDCPAARIPMDGRPGDEEVAAKAWAIAEMLRFQVRHSSHAVLLMRAQNLLPLMSRGHVEALFGGKVPECEALVVANCADESEGYARLREFLRDASSAAIIDRNLKPLRYERVLCGSGRTIRGKRLLDALLTRGITRATTRSLQTIMGEIDLLHFHDRLAREELEAAMDSMDVLSVALGAGMDTQAAKLFTKRYEEVNGREVADSLASVWEDADAACDLRSVCEIFNMDVAMARRTVGARLPEEVNRKYFTGDNVDILRSFDVFVNGKKAPRRRAPTSASTTLRPRYSYDATWTMGFQLLKLFREASADIGLRLELREDSELDANRQFLFVMMSREARLRCDARIGAVLNLLVGRSERSPTPEDFAIEEVMDLGLSSSLDVNSSREPHGSPGSRRRIFDSLWRAQAFCLDFQRWVAKTTVTSIFELYSAAGAARLAAQIGTSPAPLSVATFALDDVVDFISLELPSVARTIFRSHLQNLRSDAPVLTLGEDLDRAFFANISKSTQDATFEALVALLEAETDPTARHL